MRLMDIADTFFVHKRNHLTNFAAVDDFLDRTEKGCVPQYGTNNDTHLIFLRRFHNFDTLFCIRGNGLFQQNIVLQIHGSDCGRKVHPVLGRNHRQVGNLSFLKQIRKVCKAHFVRNLVELLDMISPAFHRLGNGNYLVLIR